MRLFNEFLYFNYIKFFFSFLTIVFGFNVIAGNLKLINNLEQVELRDFFFLSNIALSLTICTVIFGLMKCFSRILNVTHTFISTITLILETIVTLNFWILFLINPKLVKNNLDSSTITLCSVLKEFPKHLLPFIILIMEQRGKQVKKSNLHIVFFFLFTLCYFILNETYTAFTSDFLYPFFKKITFFERSLLFIIMFGISVVFYQVFLCFKRQKKCHYVSKPKRN